MSVTERRQTLLEILMSRRQETVPNLMQELGVSRCTILRDVETLSCSYPIYTVQGNGGGIRVADGYYTDRRYLKSEQEDLLRELLAGLTPEKQNVMRGILDTFAKPKAPAASGRRSA